MAVSGNCFELLDEGSDIHITQKLIIEEIIFWVSECCVLHMPVVRLLSESTLRSSWYFVIRWTGLSK